MSLRIGTPADSDGLPPKNGALGGSGVLQGQGNEAPSDPLDVPKSCALRNTKEACCGDPGAPAVEALRTMTRYALTGPIRLNL